MLISIFKRIILMSGIGGVLSILLLLLSPLTRKFFSPRWQYYIWLTVLIVMILPVRFSVPKLEQNAPSFTPNQSKITEETYSTTQQNADIKIAWQPEKMSLSKTDVPQSIFYYSANIWLLGMILTLLTKITKYNLFLKEIHKNSAIYKDIPNIPKRLTVRKTDMLDAPLLVGIFSPALFLPDTELHENDISYILMHELTHYKRSDLLYKWFSMLVTSVHWFNPLAHIVSRQIDTECEVSCDAAVASKLSDYEKKYYMNMILQLLSKSQGNFRPLTTQMATGKQTIQRRFNMIEKKKATSKIILAISLITAAIILSCSVLASGILADLTTYDYYTVDILSGSEKIVLTNKPFIQNGEVYVPLREILEKAVPKEKGVVDIRYNDGTIDIIVAYYQGESGKYQLKIGKEFMTLQHINYEDYKNNSIEKSMVVTSLSLKQPPLLINSTTYASLSDVNYMLYGYTIRRNENDTLYELSYIVYDKSGNLTAIESHPILSQASNIDYFEYNTPEYTVQRFFRFFADGHFDTMKNYCTESCIATYFNDDNVFGMKTASFTNAAFAPSEYPETPNDIHAFVTVSMTPSETSVFDPSDNTASFYLILQKQSDGRYLINDFATGISSQALYSVQNKINTLH